MQRPCEQTRDSPSARRWRAGLNPRSRLHFLPDSSCSAPSALPCFGFLDIIKIFLGSCQSCRVSLGYLKQPLVSHLLSCCSTYVKVPFSRGKEAHSASRCPGTRSEHTVVMAGPPGSSTPSLGGGSVGLVGLVSSRADMASFLLQLGQALAVLGVGVSAALVRAVREGACPEAVEC